MNAGEWQRLRHHFELLCESTPDDWPAAVAAIEESEEFRQRLLRMLQADRGERLQEVVSEQVPQLHRLASDQTTDNDRKGERLGAWEIIGAIGSGGMGKVYRAIRTDGRYQAQAAIKIVARGIDSAQFLHERNVLARLQHPNIARLLDGGECDDGRPYLVMELVEGKAIDRHCKSNHLDQKPVLRLVHAAARAVAYAHTRAVLHRDIKPENIMVDDRGQVKLLDFGVAKLLDGDTEGGHTTAAYFTPRYAASEQLSGEPATTATDIFSLAIVLFELLTGQHPFAGDDDSGDTARRQFSTEAQRLRRSLRQTRHKSSLSSSQLRDLEAILGQALQVEPAQRFQGMDSFADELQRVLQDRPAQTRHVSALERVRRWSGRNRAAALGLLLGLFSIVVGSGVAVWQAREARAQRDAAVLEARRAERVADFLSDVFRAPDPSRSRGEEVSARELLDRSRERITTELADAPALRQRLQSVMADTYRSLGLFDEAESLLLEALELAGDAPDPELFSTLGWVHAFQGRFEDSAERLRQAARRAEALGDIDAQAAALSRLATPLLNLRDADGAEAAINQALALDATLPKPDTNRRISLRGMLANIAFARGDLDSAEAQYREILALRLATSGEDSAEVAMTYGNLATVAFRRADWNSAAELYRQGIAINRRFFGVDNAQIAMQTRSLALTLRRAGETSESLRIVREAAAMMAAWTGDTHPDTIAVRLEALDLALLLGEHDPPEIAQIKQVAEALEPGSRSACQMDSLRQWWRDDPDPAVVQSARDCLIEKDASEAIQASAEVALARARVAAGVEPDVAYEPARERVSQMKLQDPALRSAVRLPNTSDRE